MWASVLSVFTVPAAGWDVEVEALWNLLIFTIFCDVAAWRMAQTEGCFHFSVLVLGVVLLSSGSCKSPTLDLVNF